MILLDNFVLTALRKDITAFSHQCQMELSLKNKPNSYAKATFKDLVKTFEVVIEQLQHCRVVTGILLTYVSDKSIILRDKDDDPLENYLSLDAKAIAHALILEDNVAFPGQSATAIALLEQNGPFCNTFHINMVMVWNILYEIFRQMPAWLHAAPTKKEKNGRKLYRLLFSHYLGSNHVNHPAIKMEACLASLTYHGEQKNWDWSQYTDAHIENTPLPRT
jgi:hypothetical protein